MTLQRKIKYIFKKKALTIYKNNTNLHFFFIIYHLYNMFCQTLESDMILNTSHLISENRCR